MSRREKRLPQRPKMAGAGAAPSAIAGWINSTSHDDRRVLNDRQSWNSKAVLRILKNPVYLGRMGAVADAHEAIVDEELFDKARAAVDARRTREPGRRATSGDDPFLLRQLLRCVHCNRLMTTSSGRALPEVTKLQRRKPVVPPRYYRCRGERACHGTQVAADDVERRVLAWLRTPTGELSPEAHFVLTRFAPIWEVLIPPVERALVAQFVWEVQWDGRRNMFKVVLDGTAIAEEHAKLALNGRQGRHRATPDR